MVSIAIAIGPKFPKMFFRETWGNPKIRESVTRLVFILGKLNRIVTLSVFSKQEIIHIGCLKCQRNKDYHEAYIMLPTHFTN